MFNRLQLPPGDSKGVVTAFRDGQVTLRENRRSDGFTFATKEIGYQGVRVGDLVVHSMDGFAGAIGVSESTGKCSPVYVVCDPKPGVDACFHAYVLRHMALSGYITSLAKGIRERSTSFGWGELKEEWLPLPTQSTQKAIANFLNRKTAAIDALIEKKQRLLELLSEKRAALINQAVTKGLDPSVPMKDSGIPWIGEIPAHWGLVAVSWFATVFNGSTPSRSRPDFWQGDVPWTASGKVNDWVVSEPTALISETARRESGLRLAPVGAVVIGMVGQGRTRGMSARLGLDTCINQNMAAIVPTHGLNSIYLHYALVQGYVGIREFGRGGQQDALNCDLVGSIRVPLPPQEEQHSIAALLDEHRLRHIELETSLIRQIDRLQEYRQALITAAVTGQIDITKESAA